MNKIDCECSMLLADAVCSTCKAMLRRGALVRMRLISSESIARTVQCQNCAATELLPLFDAQSKVWEKDLEVIKTAIVDLKKQIANDAAMAKTVKIEVHSQ